MGQLIEVRSLLEHKYGALQLIEAPEFDPKAHVLPEDFKEKKVAPKAASKTASSKKEA